MSRQRSNLEFNMFPFLSVLCSLIGVLMLFKLVVMSTRIVPKKAAGVTAAQAAWEGQGKYLSQQQHDQLSAKLDRLENSAEVLHHKVAQLTQLRDELRQLVELKTEEMVPVTGDELYVGVDICPEIDVELLPRSEHPIPKTPVFIDIQEGAYVVHPQEARYPITELPDEEADVGPDDSPESPLEKYLEEVYQRRDKEYLVFLIRPSGVEGFRRIRDYVVRKYPHPRVPALSEIQFGWEPFSRHWVYVGKAVSG